MASRAKAKLDEVRIDVDIPTGVASIRIFKNQGSGQTIKIELPKDTKVEKQTIDLGGSAYIVVSPRSRYRRGEITGVK